MILNDAPHNDSSWWKQLMINWTWAPRVSQTKGQLVFAFAVLCVGHSPGDFKALFLCSSSICGIGSCHLRFYVFPNLIHVSGTCLGSSFPNCNLATAFRLYPDIYWIHCFFIFAKEASIVLLMWLNFFIIIWSEKANLLFHYLFMAGSLHYGKDSL